MPPCTSLSSSKNDAKGPGPPQREQFEEELQAFLVGEAIKKARLSKHLTEEELGALIGVQRT
jgi:hypothetical protein